MADDTRWTRHLQFTDIRAFARNDIWASAIAAGSNSPAWVLHFNGARWTRIMLPWRVDPRSIAADGHGGLWLSALGLNGQPYAVHRTATGRFSRTPISTFLFGLTLIPGTASLWGVGGAPARTEGAPAGTRAFGGPGNSKTPRARPPPPPTPPRPRAPPTPPSASAPPPR